MKKKYVLVDKKKILVIRLFDLLGSPIRLFSKPEAFKNIKVDKIAMLQLDHIGDVIFTIPSVKEIKKLYPDAKIISIVGSWAKDILEGNLNINEIIVFDAPWFDRKQKTSQFIGIINLKNLLRQLKPDMIIDFRGDLRHNLPMYLAKIPNRVGFGITGGGFLLTKEVDFPFESHAVLRHMAIPQAMRAVTDKKRIDIEIYLSEQDINWVENFISDNELGNNILIGVHPEAGFPSKQWPIEHFIKIIHLLAKNLTDRKPVFILTGSKSILNVNNIKLPNESKVLDITGKTSLKQLAALLARLNLFICGDTGPLHIATAMNCPTVAIYSGTNDEKIWGPWNGKVEVLKVDIECSPCGKKECSDPKCLNLITPQMVLESSLKLLKVS